jgi:transcriptional regulator with XRE-family HTH domain
MGRKARPTPERLGEKLVQIRDALGLTQLGIYQLLGLEDFVSHKQISKYETGATEPPLMILLAYARTANVSLDVLADDQLDLPERLPSSKKHEGVRRRQK